MRPPQVARRRFGASVAITGRIQHIGEVHGAEAALDGDVFPRAREGFAGTVMQEPAASDPTVEHFT